MSVKEAPGRLRDHSSRIMTAGIVLALLYLGRSVLIPLALAIMLSLLVAPLVRTLRRLGVGRTSSVLVAVVALAVSCMGVAAALGTQILRIAESLPQYESNVQRKLKTLEELTIGPLRGLTDETSRLIEMREPAEARPVPRPRCRALPAGSDAGRWRCRGIRTSQPLQLMGKLLTTHLESAPIRRYRAPRTHFRVTRARLIARPLHTARRSEPIYARQHSRSTMPASDSPGTLSPSSWSTSLSG